MDTFYYEKMIELRDAFYNKESRSDLLEKVEDIIRSAKNENGYRNINDDQDYFETPMLLPDNVKTALFRLFIKPDQIAYSDLKELSDKANKLGWQFDYGLDASPYNLRPI